MRNRTILFIVIGISLVFSGCFSPWAGDEQGKLIVSMGGGNGQARAAAGTSTSAWTGDMNFDNFLHVITITGHGQKQEKRFIGGNASASFTVETGRWNIKVKAYDLNRSTGGYPDNLEQIQLDDLALVAVGSSDVNVKTGSNFVAIKMGQPSYEDLLETLRKDEYLITVGVITGQNGWLDINYEARGDLVYGNVKITYGDNAYTQYDGRVINNIFKKSDTVKIEAIPNTTGTSNFKFEKWVLLEGTTAIPSNGSAINENHFSGSATIGNLFDDNNLKIIGNTKAICLLAVFDGDGNSSDSPKNITNETELQNISANLDKYYALMTDLKLTGSWTPIGTGTGTSAFNGSLNGMGHTITYALNEMKNVSNGSSEECAGLFGVIGNAGVVKNLILKGSISNVNHNPTYSLYIGAVAGENRGSSIIKNVVSLVNIYSSVASTTGKIYAGGIAGKNSSLIENCAGVGAIGNNTSSIDYGGGIVGLISAKGRVYCCWASGEIDIKKESGYAGGIAGSITGANSGDDITSIRNCLAVNSIISTSTPGNTGRIVGNSSGICDLSNNYANVYGYTPISPNSNNKEGATVGNSSISGNNYYDSAWWTTDSNWYTSVKYWGNSISLNEAKIPDEDTPWIWASSRYGTNLNAPYLILWFSK